MTVSLVACSSASAPAETAPAATEEAATEESADVDYKIGIITGTVSQGEEEYQAAQNL